jgi:membrane associated rhomboid family serine protease
VIPLRDTIPSQRFPAVNYAIIGLCAFAFYLELTAPDTDAFVNAHALTPATFVRLATHRGWSLALLQPFLTSMFLHGGFMHIAGNMLFLWIFGDNVEDRLGHVGYAIFYLVGGLVAGATHVLSNPQSLVPTVGASGAIAAVMGAYMVLYPGSRIETMVIVFVFVRIVAVPALVWLGLWFAFQVLSANAGAHGPDQGGIAVFAHIGGFAFGAVVGLLLKLRMLPQNGRSYG